MGHQVAPENKVSKKEITSLNPNDQLKGAACGYKGRFQRLAKYYPLWN